MIKKILMWPINKLVTLIIFVLFIIFVDLLLIFAVVAPKKFNKIVNRVGEWVKLQEKENNINV